MDATFAERADPALRPSLTQGRNTFTYYAGMIRIPAGSTPDLKNRSYTITAEVFILPGGASGVLATQGGDFGGWGFVVLENKPVFIHALSNQLQHKYKVASTENLTPGNHTIRFEFTYDGGDIGSGGAGVLKVDGKEVARAHIERTVCCRFSLDETFDVGQDTGSPVIRDYADKMPFKFTGTLRKVVIELAPPSPKT